MTMSPLGTIISAALLLAFVVWVFWQAGGGAPKDSRRHKEARRHGRRLFKGIPRGGGW